jgi:hypothetical protein
MQDRSRRIDEVLLRRTAVPYIGSMDIRTASITVITWRDRGVQTLAPRLAWRTRSRMAPIWSCQAFRDEGPCSVSAIDLEHRMTGRNCKLVCPRCQLGRSTFQGRVSLFRLRSTHGASLWRDSLCCVQIGTARDLPFPGFETNETNRVTLPTNRIPVDPGWFFPDAAGLIVQDFTTALCCGNIRAL